MASSNTNVQAIRHGPWVDWEKGPIMGSQVTLSSRDAQILSSFLGIFVTLVGVQLWQIISFLIHQLRSSEGHSDALHHQTQVVLRNTASPWSAAKAFLEQLWVWRRHAARSFYRTVPWAVVAVTYALGFAVISIFAASEITKAPGNTRLLKSQNCGFLNDTYIDRAGNNAWALGQLQDANTAAQYARSCYPGNDTSSTVSCDLFAKPFLPMSTSHVDCPFDSSECANNNSSPFQMDSGLLDSHVHLGINSPKYGRIQYRKVFTCSPIHTKPYVSVYNVTDADTSPYGGDVGDQIVVVDMGPFAGENYTYDINLHRGLDSIGYTLESMDSEAGMVSSWEPVASLNRTDADVALVAISANAIEFLEACDDPIFAAHNFRPVTLDDGQPSGYYKADYSLGAMACTEQYQYCNPNNNKCTDLTSQSLAGQGVFKLGINDLQGKTALRINTGSIYSTIIQTINGRQASALQAQNQVNELQQYFLPAYQWEIEAASWFRAGLARLQMDVQEYASRSFSNVKNITAPAANDTIGKRMCDNQITSNTLGTVSFSLVGLGIVICLGAFIIILGFVLEPITTYLQRRTGNGVQRARDWALNDKLQLHRMALESRGVGPWYDPAKSVPVTEKYVTFAGWRSDDLEDATVPAPNTYPSKPEEQMGSAENKPFMAEHQGDTRYHGTPVMTVEEIR